MPFTGALSDNDILNILLRSNDATAIYNGEDMIIRMVNDEMIRIWGKDRDVIGKKLEDVLPELQGQPFISLLKKIWHTGETYVAKDMPAQIAIDGKLQTFYFDFEYRAIRNDQGEIYAILNTSNDVTEKVLHRKALEEIRSLEAEHARALRESEYNLRLVILQAPVAIAIFRGPDYVTEIANKHALELWGRTEAEVIGRPILEAMPELVEQGIPPLLDAVYHKGEKFFFSERPVQLQRGDHLETLYLNFSYEPVYDADGNINGFITIGSDISEQVNARLALARAEEMLRFSVEAAGAATWYMDIATHEFVFSDSMYEMYGVDRSKGQGYPDMLSRVPKEYRHLLTESVENTVQKGIPYLMEHPVVTDDGKERWVRAVGKRYDAEGKWNAHFSGLTIDITDLKQEEQRKNDFIGMVSHELKTPLTSLSALVQVMNKKLADSEDAFLGAAADKATTQVKKMAGMINGFLNVSRLESGQLQLNLSEANICQLLEETIWEAQLVHSGYVIELESCPDITMAIDREKVGSVLANLLSNAAKYSPKSEIVIVRCLVEEHQVLFSVHDKGIGIPKAELPKLFDRYYRVKSVETQHVSGFGIGLYLSAEIVHLHGGRIWAESEPGNGADFYFTIPFRQ